MQGISEVIIFLRKGDRQWTLQSSRFYWIFILHCTDEKMTYDKRTIFRLEKQSPEKLKNARFEVVHAAIILPPCGTILCAE